MKYFVFIKGKRLGPYTFCELKSKNIFNTTLVWKEGMKEWQQAKKIDELKEIILISPPPLLKGKLSIDDIVKIFFIHLFFGVGFFYVDRTVKRKYLYPAFGFYALLDVILGPGLGVEEFESDFGFVTFLISLIICYLVGYIDVYYCRYRISSEKNYL